MNDLLERAKQELVDAYESRATVDIAEWLARYPTVRDELLDFWMWLSSTTRVDELAPQPDGLFDDRVIPDAVREACLAVSLGPQWLEEAVDLDGRMERELGAELGRLRQHPYEHHGTASKPFRRAAVYAWIVHALAARQRKATRLATQKVAYLLERGLALGLFDQHVPQRLGPYDSAAKYRDAEPIAVRQGWVRVSGATLIAASQRSFVEYATRYMRSQLLAERLLDRLARLSDSELETWATVAWVSAQLTTNGAPVTSEAVLGQLADSPTWRGKLLRPGFRVASVTTALVGLMRLGLAGR